MAGPRHTFSSTEQDTKPGRAPSARPTAPSGSEWRPDFNDPPASWRPRPPLESTTYSIVPGARARSTPVPSSSAPRPAPSLPIGGSTSAAAKDGEALSPAQYAAIDAMYSSLTNITHYELLGVARDADAATIKRAFDDVAAALHPERFARKRLGPYRRKLEILLTCVNDAYATLAAPDLRALYDEHLARPHG